jgi:hypothetical protein
VVFGALPSEASIERRGNRMVGIEPKVVNVISPRQELAASAQDELRRFQATPSEDAVTAMVADHPSLLARTLERLKNSADRAAPVHRRETDGRGAWPRPGGDEDHRPGQGRSTARGWKRSAGRVLLAGATKGFNTLRDFRRVAEQLSSEWSAALHAEYRRAHAQPNVLLELAELEDEAPARDWSWRFQMMTRLLQRLRESTCGDRPHFGSRRPEPTSSGILATGPTPWRKPAS